MTTLSIPRRSEIRGAVLVGGTGLAALVAGKMVTQPPRARMLLAVALVGLFSVLALRTPRAVMFAVIVWLALLGTLRRIWAIDYTGSLGDVLLLVAPLVWAALGLVAIHYGALRSCTRLTTAFLALAGLLALSALNPLQGSLTVGVAGALLTVGPMMAFLVGRALVDDATMLR